MPTRKLADYVNEAKYFLPDALYNDFDGGAFVTLLAALLMIKDELEVTNEHLKVISKMGTITKM